MAARIGGLAASTLLVLALALASASAAVIPASQESGSLSAQASVGPEGFNASFTLEAPLPANVSSNIQELAGGLDFTYDRGSCGAGLNGSLTLASPLLENLTVNASLSGTVEGEAEISNASISYAYNTTSALELAGETLDTNGNPVILDLSATIARSVQGEAQRGSDGAPAGSTSQSSYQAMVDTQIYSQQGTFFLSIQLQGSSESGSAANSSWGTGQYSGSLSFTTQGMNVVVDLNGNYEYTVNLTGVSEDGNITLYVDLHSETQFHFNNYLYAEAFYTMVDAIVENLSLQDIVTVTPPSLFDPTVGVIVEYEGPVSIPGAANATLPGLPWNATTPQVPGWLQGLMPSLEGELGGSLSYNATLTVEDSTLTAGLAAHASLWGSPCNSSYGVESAWLDVGLDSGQQALVVSGGAEGYSAEPFTSGLLVARGLYRLLDAVEGNLSSANVSLAGCCSVEFDINGSRSGSLAFDLGNYTLLEDVGVYYQGALLREPGGPLEVGPGAPGNLTLPPIAGGILAQGVYSLNLTVPIPGPVNRSLRVVFHNDVAENATLLISKGATLQGSLHLATLQDAPGIVGDYGTAAGPTLEVDGVTGNVTVVLPYNGDPDRAALLVVHSNGEVELVQNVIVMGGYIEANVTASSTYTPIELSGGGGQPPSTTTSTETQTSTTTSPETTTSQPSTTTSTPPRTTATTNPSQTGTSTQMPTTTQSSTTQPTATSSTGAGSSPAGTQTGGTTGEAGKTGRATAIAAVIVIVVIIAAAAVLLRR